MKKYTLLLFTAVVLLWGCGCSENPPKSAIDEAIRLTIGRALTLLNAGRLNIEDTDSWLKNFIQVVSLDYTINNKGTYRKDYRKFIIIEYRGKVILSYSSNIVDNGMGTKKAVSNGTDNRVENIHGILLFEKVGEKWDWSYVE